MTNDVVLWNKFREGDDEAFSSLFSLYFSSLCQYGVRFDVSEDLVKDCIQDIFIHLYSHGNLPAVDNPKFYLFRALKNSILNKLTKEKRMLTVSMNKLPFIAEYEMNHVDIISEEADEIDLVAHIQKVLTLLPPRQKEAIYLRFQQNMSYEEISEMLKMNYQSTRNLVFRAIQNLRKNSSMHMIFFI